MLDHMITVRGETVEKAIEKGLKELGITRDQANIHVISEGKKGLFGFGKQDAIVEIIHDTDISYKEITEQLEEEQSIQEKVEQAKVEQVETKEETQGVSLSEVAQADEPSKAKEIAEETQSDKFISEEAPVENKEFEAEPTPQAKEEVLPNAAQVRAGGAVNHQEKDSKVRDTEESKGQDADDEREEGLSLEESSEKVAKYIDQVIKEYGAQSDTEFELRGNQVTFNIDTDKSGLVIGKHGKIINSLQILSQTLLQSYYRKRVSVLLNVGDYRDRRANVLEQIAERTADEVTQTRQTVILDPLPAYERKQIHAHLSKYDHIKTHSEGKEPNRYLVIEYKS